MKCRYTFPVRGRLRIAAVFPIPCADVVFDLGVNPLGIVTSISATVDANDKELWPTITRAPAPGIAAEITIRAPRLEMIERQFAIVEGLLAVYGVESIQRIPSEHEWLPESEEERGRLRLFSFGHRSERIADEKIAPVSFDLIARAIIGAPKAVHADVALSFYRKGRNDFIERRYIEAIYNFYGSSRKSVGKFRGSIGVKGAWMLGLGAFEGRGSLA